MPQSSSATKVAGFSERLEQALRQLGLEKLKPKQTDCIEARAGGQDVLGVLPTGYGKSACFQLPGMALKERTIVISPLKALQEDQARKLRKRGVKAFAYHSGLDEFQKASVHFYYRTAPKDEASFLYISPELLLTETFHQRFDSIKFGHVAVDEAHCVSTWGDNFRPEYQRIRVAVDRLGIPSCSAFTATVDPKIEKDIMGRIPLRNLTKVAADPMRPNLRLLVKRHALNGPERGKGRQKIYRLMSLLKEPEFCGPTIIYYNSLRGVVSLYDRLANAYGFLQETGHTPVLFHSMLIQGEKDEALKKFLTLEKPLMIATSAFGMGIDRPDVRQIVHYNNPRSLVDYAQQFGRAGRDDLPALCTTFWGRDSYDEEEMEREVEFEMPEYDFIERHLERLRAIVGKKTPEQRKRYNLRSYTSSMKHVVETSDQIRYKAAYMDRIQMTIGLLQRAGCVEENADGLTVHPLIPGNPRHLKLLELTKMQERMLLRERRRLMEFFASANPSQEQLWSMLRVDT